MFITITEIYKIIFTDLVTSDAMNQINYFVKTKNLLKSQFNLKLDSYFYFLIVFGTETQMRIFLEPEPEP